MRINPATQQLELPVEIIMIDYFDLEVVGRFPTLSEWTAEQIEESLSNLQQHWPDNFFDYEYEDGTRSAA